MEKRNEQSKSNKVAATQENVEKNFTFTFDTIGGPKVVEILDKKIVNFINTTKNFEDNWGDNPTTPIDFIQIANQLYYDDMITEQDRDYYYEKFSDIFKNYCYNN